MAKTALVTGASAGIGAAFARALSARGYDLVLVARDRGRLEAIATELGARSRVRVHSADLCDAEGLASTERIAGEAPLDLLVNNAGFGTAGAFADLPMEAEHRQIALNVVALVHLTRAALPGMLSRGSGAIVNVSSVQGFAPSPYVATYGATKAYVNAFTESISLEVEGKGVTVQALCPGFTRTEFQTRAHMKTDAIPSGAWMTPEAVVAASLASLDRGDLYCVPGVQNQTLTAALKVVPRPLVRRITTLLNRRVI